VNAFSAVLFVPVPSAWRPRAASWLARLGADPTRVGAWLDVLERRADGAHDWREVLANETFPDGRAMPVVRA